MSKEKACELFLAAIFEDATEIGRQIASEVSDRGKNTTLTDNVGLPIFCAEWYLAKLAWLSRRAAELTDSELRQYLSSLINQSIEELADLYQDDPMAYPNYWILADAYDSGERDRAGLPMGPGPIISHRYEKNLERMKPKEFFKPSDEEMLFIMAAGDSLCWTLGHNINDGLANIVSALNKDEMS